MYLIWQNARIRTCDHWVLLTFNKCSLIFMKRSAYCIRVPVHMYLRTLWVQIMFKEFCDIINGYWHIGFLLIFLTVYWYLISNSCQFFAISLAQVYSDSLEFIWYLTTFLKYKVYIFLNFLTLPRSIYKFGNYTRTIFLHLVL